MCCWIKKICFDVVPCALHDSRVLSRLFHCFVKIISCIVVIYYNSSKICQDVVLQSVWDYVVICYVDSVNPK